MSKGYNDIKAFGRNGHDRYLLLQAPVGQIRGGLNFCTDVHFPSNETKERYFYENTDKEILTKHHIVIWKKTGV